MMRIFRKILVVLLVGILVLGVGSSDTALWFKLVIIVLLAIGGVGLLLTDDEEWSQSEFS